MVFGCVQLDVQSMVSTDEGYSKLALCICAFRKYVVVFPLKSEKAEEFAPHFENDVL